MRQAQSVAEKSLGRAAPRAASPAHEPDDDHPSNDRGKPDFRRTRSCALRQRFLNVLDGRLGKRLADFGYQAVLDFLMQGRADLA